MFKFFQNMAHNFWALCCKEKNEKRKRSLNSIRKWPGKLHRKTLNKNRFVKQSGQIKTRPVVTGFKDCSIKIMVTVGIRLPNTSGI